MWHGCAGTSGKTFSFSLLQGWHEYFPNDDTGPQFVRVYVRVKHALKLVGMLQFVNSTA